MFRLFFKGIFKANFIHSQMFVGEFCLCLRNIPLAVMKSMHIQLWTFYVSQHIQLVFMWFEYWVRGEIIQLNKE